MATFLYKVTDRDGIGVIEISGNEGGLYTPYHTSDFLISFPIEDCKAWSVDEVVQKLYSFYSVVEPITDLGGWILYMDPELEDGRKKISLKAEFGCTIPIAARDIRLGDLVFNGAQSFMRFWKGEQSRKHFRTGVFEVTAI